MSELVNASLSGLNSLSSFSSYAPIMIIVIMLSIALIIFLFVKFFRLFVYGFITTAGIGGLYWVSNGITTSTVNGDYFPIKCFGAIGGTIIVSIIIGWILFKIPFIKKIDDNIKFKDDGDEK